VDPQIIVDKFKERHMVLIRCYESLYHNWFWRIV